MLKSRLVSIREVRPMYDEMSDEDYKAQHDCETLAHAYKIKKDKMRYKDAIAYAKKKMTTLEGVVEDK